MIEMILGGWNSEGLQAILSLILVLFEVRWRWNSGWNSLRAANITKNHPGRVKDAIEEKKMIPGGWNRQRKASNNQ